MLIMSLLLGFSVISSLHINYFCVLLFWWLTPKHGYLTTFIDVNNLRVCPPRATVAEHFSLSPTQSSCVWPFVGNHATLAGGPVISNVVCTIRTRPTYKCHANTTASTWIRAWYSRRCLKTKFHSISLTIVGQIWQPWSYVYNLSRRHHNQSVTEV